MAAAEGAACDAAAAWAPAWPAAAQRRGAAAVRAPHRD